MLLEALQFVVGAARNAVFTHAYAEAPKPLDWGNKILWHTSLTEAEKVSVKTKKPIMVIIYHESCPSCKLIIPRFTESEDITSLARTFIVVALHNSTAPESLNIDGDYVPRIIFMSPMLEVHKQYYNVDGNPKYKYFYNNEAVLSKTMKQVLKDYDLCHGKVCEKPVKGPDEAKKLPDNSKKKTKKTLGFW